MASWQRARLQAIVQFIDQLLTNDVISQEHISNHLGLDDVEIAAYVQDLNEIGVLVDITPNGYCIPSALVERESQFSLQNSILLALGLKLLEVENGIGADTADSIRVQLFPQSDDGLKRIREDAPVYTTIDHKTLAALRAAVWKKQRLSIAYHSRESKENVEREISPYTFVHRRAIW